MPEGSGRFEARASTIQGLVQGDNNTVALTYNVYGSVATIASGPAPEPRPVPTPVHVLPPAFAELLDRTGELDAVLAAVEMGLPVEVTGEPGAGKTSLLRVVARHPRAGGHSGGLVYREYRGDPTADFVQALFDCFYETPGTIKLGDARLRRHLGRIQAVVIVDDADLDRADLESLRNAAAGCTFVIASTTRRLYAEGRAVTVGGLPPGEAATFLGRQLGRELAGADQEAAERLCRALGGHPLRIQQAVGLMETTGVTMAQLADGLSHQAPAGAGPRLAHRLVSSLAPPAVDVLAAAAGLGGTALPADHATALTGHDSAGALLVDLERWGLARAHSPRFTVDAGVAELVAGAGAVSPERLVTWATRRALSGRRPSPDERDLAVAAVAAAVRSGQGAAAVDLARWVEPVLAESGRWATWETVLGGALTGAREAGDLAGEGWALHQLGTCALGLERYHHADAILAEALVARRRAGDLEGARATRANLDTLAALTAPAAPVEAETTGPGAEAPGPVIPAAAARRRWPVAVAAVAVAGAGLAGGVALRQCRTDVAPPPTTPTTTVTTRAGTQDPSTTIATSLTATALERPEVAKASPSQLRTLRGTGFEPGARVTADGFGISVSVRSQSPDALRVAVTTSSDTRVGTYDLTVASGGRQAVCAKCLVVTPRPIAKAVTPPRVAAGSTVDVAVEGANFAPGATVSFSGPGVVVTQVRSTSPSRVVVTVAVAPGTDPGSRNATVDNGDGGVATCSGCLRVLPQGPP